jgi:hypothetical protein
MTKSTVSRSNPYSAEDIELLEGLDAAVRGGWITAVERLIRWLRNNDCNEYAQPLAREARAFHYPPDDRHRELRALQSVLSHLNHLRAEPPTDLDAKRRKKLSVLVKDARELVQHRQKELPGLIESEGNEKNTMRDWMDEHGWSSVENELEGEFLGTLFSFNAVDSENRRSLKEVVKAMFDKPANAKNYKKLSARLRRKGLIDSKPGKAGGIWLTQRGIEYVEQKRVPENLRTCNTV